MFESSNKTTVKNMAIYYNTVTKEIYVCNYFNEHRPDTKRFPCDSGIIYTKRRNMSHENQRYSMFVDFIYLLGQGFDYQAVHEQFMKIDEYAFAYLSERTISNDTNNAENARWREVEYLAATTTDSRGLKVCRKFSF